MANLVPPQDEERQLLRFLDAIDSETDSVKRNVGRSWEENIRQVRGDQWRLKRSPYFLANLIKNSVKRKVGALTETAPQIRVQALKVGLDKSSNVLYNTAKSIFDRDNTRDTIYKVGLYGMTMGSSFFRVSYDPVGNDVHVEFVDSRRVFLDPGISDGTNMDDGEYVRLDTVLPLHRIRSRYPGRGMLVTPDEKYGSFPQGAGTQRTSILSQVLSTMPRPYRPGVVTKQGPIPRALVKEYWVRDPQINTSGELLFPGGRHVVRSQNIILRDEPNPYWDGGWDLVLFEWDVDFDSPWGLNEVEDLRRIQEAINRMGDAWVKNVLLGSNFKVIADLDALDPDQWDRLDNGEGLIIRKKPQRQFDYVPPIELGTTIPTSMAAFIQLIDLLTGNMDTQGGKNQATESSTLEGLQMARQTLIRSVARRMESALERVGQKLISRIFQYYNGDRVLFQLGPNRDWISYIFERMKILEDDKGNVRPIEDVQKYFRDYRFLITPGSSLALSRIQRTMTLLQLRSATGFAPSVKRILSEADIGDVDSIMREGLEELNTIPPPPPPKGRGGRT